MLVVGGGVFVVASNNAMANEHITTNPSSGSDKTMGTNDSTVTDTTIFLDFCERTYLNIISYCAIVDITWMIYYTPSPPLNTS